MRSKLLAKIFIAFFFFITYLAFGYVLSFNHYNPDIRSYISYVIFEDKQSITDYRNNTIYLFNFPSIKVLNELEILKGQTFPAAHIPPLEKTKKNNIGTIAQIYKGNQVMYLYDYLTPSFYKSLDFKLRGLVVTLEDNIRELLSILYSAEKIEYKPYLNYLKSFSNINDDFELILCYPKENNRINFEFLNKKSNRIKKISIDKYYGYDMKEEEYPNNSWFTF